MENQALSNLIAQYATVAYKGNLNIKKSRGRVPVPAQKNDQGQRTNDK